MALTSGDLQAIAALIKTNNESISSQMKAEFESVNKRLARLELTLENEVVKGINIIGEGHAILNRRLDEALKVTSEAEVLQLRVLWLERELRTVKERLEEIEQTARYIST